MCAATLCEADGFCECGCVGSDLRRSVYVHVCTRKTEPSTVVTVVLWQATTRLVWLADTSTAYTPKTTSNTLRDGSSAYTICNLQLLKMHQLSNNLPRRHMHASHFYSCTFSLCFSPPSCKLTCAVCKLPSHLRCIRTLAHTSATHTIGDSMHNWERQLSAQHYCSKLHNSTDTVHNK